MIWKFDKWFLGISLVHLMFGIGNLLQHEYDSLQYNLAFFIIWLFVGYNGELK